MFKRILVGVDLSPASMLLVECLGVHWAETLKRLGVKECILVHCLNMSEITATTFLQAKNMLEANLNEYKKILENQGFITKTEVVAGLAEIEINRLAKERNCSLVVIGSHGETLASEILLGGVACGVIHHAIRPVLVIPIKKDAEKEISFKPEKCDLIRHVLFPTDFSENADFAFRYLREIVGAGARKITLVHVQDKTKIAPYLQDRLEEFNRVDRERLEKMGKALREAGPVEVDIRIPYGSPVSEIIRLIRELEVNLVVLGTQGRGYIKEIFLGSVGHNITRISPAPVMLVPVWA
ncbi:MAG: universal stress protein [Candidatus Omnitrophica bacterium]|nr:universal stress protein [Candidatus Omnitrophota bacterium]